MHTVQHVLRSRKLVTAAPAASVYEVACLMSESGVGALPIVDRKRLVGVFSVRDLMTRVLVFPAYTVAAMNGHAFGAGAQIALAHDTRVMRADRGYFCMPEIDMKAPLHPGMTAIIQARLPHQSAHEVIVTGTRYGGELALSRKIVDEAVPEDEVLPRAIAIAAQWAPKADPAMAVLKRGMYPRALEALATKLEV